MQNYSSYELIKKYGELNSCPEQTITNSSELLVTELAQLRDNYVQNITTNDERIWYRYANQIC